MEHQGTSKKRYYPCHYDLPPPPFDPLQLFEDELERLDRAEFEKSDFERFKPRFRLARRLQRKITERLRLQSDERPYNPSFEELKEIAWEKARASRKESEYHQNPPSVFTGFGFEFAKLIGAQLLHLDKLQALGLKRPPPDTPENRQKWRMEADKQNKRLLGFKYLTWFTMGAVEYNPTPQEAECGEQCFRTYMKNAAGGALLLGGMGFATARFRQFRLLPKVGLTIFTAVTGSLWGAVMSTETCFRCFANIPKSYHSPLRESLVHRIYEWNPSLLDQMDQKAGKDVPRMPPQSPPPTP